MVLPNQQTFVWNENTAVDLQSIVDEQGNEDTTLTGYFKANIKYAEPREQVFDYGLHLINQILHGRNKRLQDWPSMPLPQMDWPLHLETD